MAACWLILTSFATPVQAFFHTSCPTAADLRDGIVVTDMGTNAGDIFHWRQLDGEVFGFARTAGLLSPNRISLWRADLVELAQVTATGIQVVSATDLTGFEAFLQMEPGTAHNLSYTRTLILKLGGEDRLLHLPATWNVKISRALQVKLGDCTYSGVEITGQQTLTTFTGHQTTHDVAYTYIPELRLQLEGGNAPHGTVVAVRVRNANDGTAWPFSPDAADIVEDFVQ